MEQRPTTARPRSSRRAIIGACLAFPLVLAAVWATLERDRPLAAPFSNPEVVRRIVAGLPAGWHLLRVNEDQIPASQHYGDGYRERWHGGEELTIVGPTNVSVNPGDGVISSTEALELWIMPRDYPDGSMPLAFFSHQVAEQIFRDRDVKIYALPSRVDGHGKSLDAMVSDVYSEDSALEPVRTGLPISWKSYRADIGALLERRYISLSD